MARHDAPARDVVPVQCDLESDEVGPAVARDVRL
jgi:hypothetical protein